jgi:phage-related protein
LVQPTLPVPFFRLPRGGEPVRAWLRALPQDARKALGEDIKTVQFGWPMGMPLVRKVESGLWEIRSHLPDGIARIFFSVAEDQIVLLHGLIKKAQRTPKAELDVARRRRQEIARG